MKNLNSDSLSLFKFFKMECHAKKGCYRPVTWCYFLTVVDWCCFDDSDMLCLTQLTIEPHHEKACLCICENKGADQLCSNWAADQHLCFHYIHCR